MIRSEIKDQDYLYKLIISQLSYDGFKQAAGTVAQELGMSVESAAASNKLMRLVNLARQYEDDPDIEKGESLFQYNGDSVGLDLEYGADITPTAPEPASYELVYASSHKAPCRSGSLAAIGSSDCSIKIYDIEKIIAREVRGEPISEAEQSQPVIRTLYDHVDEVSCVTFHPREPILISGSYDKTIKFFDYSKMAVKRCMRSLVEAEPVRAFAIHPGGEFLAVAVNHPTLRLYNIETQQCFVSAFPGDQHVEAVVDVCYADSAKLLVTGSLDGDVKLWDGISGRCVQTFARAHDNIPIRSVKFTRNGKYVLTTGNDSSVKLWELSTNRCLVNYTGVSGADRVNDNCGPACFNHNEDYVMLPDDKSGNLCSWNARTGDRKRYRALGHAAAVRDFIHSRTSPAFITCSDDCKARFWYKKL
uniref:Cleavage stimulation factor 50 kDa subunit n=1 Tax=Panagrellus redivivus TaxID=6233 RepID=A0A7E5A0K5_PANRE